MNYDLLLKSIIDLAERAGKDIINIYNNSIDYNITYKSDSSPLTAADKASNKTICDGLEKITPDIPIISEEGKDISYSKRKTWKTFWLIDPLDGTKEFINKNGEFSVNIALIDNNVPIMGVVHAPVIQTTWYGSVYHKSYKINNNKTFNIKVNSPNKEESIKVVSSRSHSNNPKLEKYLKQFKNYSLVKMGSSIKICLVADGTAHVYPRFGPTMEWDTAAAHAVVKYAGGNIFDLNTDEELRYNKKNLLNPEFLVDKGHSL